MKRKVVIVGDGACGKTSLLYTFTLGEFPEEYHPTVFENYVTDCRIDGKPVQLHLWDTAGQEEYERLRPLSYNNLHVILIAFALDEPDLLTNAASKWVAEVHQYCPGTPYLLVGLKLDLRLNTGRQFVQPELGEQTSTRIGAKQYLESLALTGHGVDDIFEAATRIAMLNGIEKESNGCCNVI